MYLHSRRSKYKIVFLRNISRFSLLVQSGIIIPYQILLSSPHPIDLDKILTIC